MRTVVVLRERLRLPVVTNLEVLARERRDEAAVPIRDGDEDPNRVACATKHLLPAAGGGVLNQNGQQQEPGQLGTKTPAASFVEFTIAG